MRVLLLLAEFFGFIQLPSFSFFILFWLHKTPILFPCSLFTPLLTSVLAVRVLFGDMSFLFLIDVGLKLQCDSKIGKRFCWSWLEQTVIVSLHMGDNVTTTLKEFVRKPDIAGKAWCSWCQDLIDYSSRGWTQTSQDVQEVYQKVTI